MKSFKSLFYTLCLLVLAVSIHAAQVKKLTVFEKVGDDVFGTTVGFFDDATLIGSTFNEPGSAADVFCLAQTPEQIGFVIDTLEAMVIDGVLIEGQASSLVAKLDAAQSQFNTENISAVFNELEDFIKKVHNMVNNGKLTAKQGLLPINFILAVICRT